MSGKSLAPGEAVTLLEKRLAVLRAQFLTSLADKENELEDALSLIAAYGQKHEHLARVYYIAHNIVGVAPTHGLESLAGVALRAEALLSRAVLPPHASIGLDDILLVADDLAEEIRQALGGVGPI